jgi:hypothetical protein
MHRMRLEMPNILKVDAFFAEPQAQPHTGAKTPPRRQLEREGRGPHARAANPSSKTTPPRSTPPPASLVLSKLTPERANATIRAA